MSSISKAQLSKIHVLLNQYGLMAEKPALVHSFSNGRTTSSKELNSKEAADFIKYLHQEDANDRMRRKIFALAYEANIIYGETPDDKKMNSIKLNKFIEERGTVKKHINKMNREELIKTVTQFEQLNKHKEESKASHATKSMLLELNIPTSKNRLV